MDSAESVIPVLPHRFQGGTGRSRSPEAIHQVAGVIGVSPDPEPEDDLALLPVGQFEWNLDGCAGVQTDPHLAGEPRPSHCSRTPMRAVASQEFSAVAGEGPN